MSLLKKLAVSSLILMSPFTFAHGKLDTVIAVHSIFDNGAKEDILRSDSINHANVTALTDKVDVAMKQSLIASEQFRIKVVRNGSDEKAINKELAVAQSGSEVQKASTYMIDEQARFLVMPTITAISAQRIVTKMSNNVFNYRDTGSMTLNVRIVDSGKVDGENQGKGAGHQLFSQDVTVYLKEPYKRLTNSNKQLVNASFWNDLIKKATAKATSVLLERRLEPMKILSVTHRTVIVNRGSNTSDIEKGQKFNIIDDNDEIVGVIKIRSVLGRTSKAKIISKTGNVEEDFTLEEQDEDDDAASSF